MVKWFRFLTLGGRVVLCFLTGAWVVETPIKNINHLTTQGLLQVVYKNINHSGPPRLQLKSLGKWFMFLIDQSGQVELESGWYLNWSQTPDKNINHSTTQTPDKNINHSTTQTPIKNINHSTTQAPVKNLNHLTTQTPD